MPAAQPKTAGRPRSRALDGAVLAAAGRQLAGLRASGERRVPPRARDIKPIHTAVNADAAQAALDDLEENWAVNTGRCFGCGVTRGTRSSAG